METDRMEDILMKPERNEPEVRDPVCGMVVSRSGACEEVVLGGKTYYFCSGSCREKFEEQPEAFIKRHRQHGVA